MIQICAQEIILDGDFFNRIKLNNNSFNRYAFNRLEMVSQQLLNFTTVDQIIKSLSIFFECIIS